MNSLRLAAVVAVLAAATGCAPYGSVQASNGKACDVELFAPEVEGARIVGRALAVCDVTPITHVMNVGIERLSNGAWSPVLAAGVGWSECRDLPRPGTPALCERRVACESGDYRTTATVTGESGGRSFAFTPDERPKATVVCSP